MTKFTNNGRAAFRIGGVTLRPGATADIEVSEAEMGRLQTKSFLGIEGVERKPESMTLEQLNTATSAAPTTDAALVARNDELERQLERIKAELTSSAASVSDLEDQLAAKDARIAELEALIPSDSSDDDVVVGLVAKHRGAGSYSVMKDDEEIVSGLTKDQTDEFNGLDDAGKTRWVRDVQASGA